MKSLEIRIMTTFGLKIDFLTGTSRAASFVTLHYKTGSEIDKE